MPEKTRVINGQGKDASTQLLLAYGALEKLGWSIKYAAEGFLLGYTPRKWNKYESEITVRLIDGDLSVTSKMIHGEAMDIRGRNKKHLDEFEQAFESLRSNYTEEQMKEWENKTSQLRIDTVTIAEQEVARAKEIDSVMKFSSSNLYLTYAIIAINVIVFVVMVFNGVPVIAPTGIDIIRWGGNFAPLTQSGDWWRLVTCMFVHIGVIHLAFNMYALYMIGIYLEPLLGKGRFLVAYICSGVFASLVSLWWHDTPVASAGASGAIFGMYGLFLALLSTKLIPKDVRDSFLKSIGIFIVYNLVYGMRSGVDNAAHVGGLISGGVIGYVFFIGMREQTSGNRRMALTGIVAVATIASAFFYLENRKVSTAERNSILSELEFFKNDGAEKFTALYDKIIELQDTAIAPLNKEYATVSEQLEKINSISRPAWNKADSLVKELQTIGAGDDAKRRASVMQEYITWRIKELNVIEDLLMNPSDSLQKERDIITTNINRTVDELGRRD